VKNKKAEKAKNFKSYSRYSGMVYQMIFTLFIAIWGGLKADAYFGLEKNYLTVVLCLAVLSAFFYKIYMDVGSTSSYKKNDDNSSDSKTDV